MRDPCAAWGWRVAMGAHVATTPDLVGMRYLARWWRHRTRISRRWRWSLTRGPRPPCQAIMRCWMRPP